MNLMSFYLKSRIIQGSKPGVYEFEEFGVTYELNYEQFNLLKNAFSVSQGDVNNSIEKWYKSLDRFTRKEVKRTGNLKDIDNGFYPDPISF
jgi:hypothetical protein